MRTNRFGLTMLAAAAFLTAGALAATSLLAQQPAAPAQQPAPGQPPAPALAPPKPYKPVTIKLPVAVADPAFVAFRKQLGDVAQKKDRAALAKQTQTDPGDWGYPVKDGVEVRSAGKPDAPVTDKLGLYLVRVYPDESTTTSSQGPDFIRVVLPPGKTGYVAGDQLLSLGNEQLCYVKEGAGWKIAGFISTQ